MDQHNGTSHVRVNQSYGGRAKRHIPPHSAQPRHTNHWAPRTRKRHQQEHRPQRPTERSDPAQHAKGRTGDCPGPRKETTTRRTVTQGGGVADLLNPQKRWGHGGCPGAEGMFGPRTPAGLGTRGGVALAAQSGSGHCLFSFWKDVPPPMHRSK